jgi:hypothetical protein
MADINDVYMWMSTDGTKVNLVLTVSPADNFTGTKHFDNTVQYAFHVTSWAGATNTDAFGNTAGATRTDVICTFKSDSDGSCWVVAAGETKNPKDYVTGDFEDTGGVVSAGGKMRVFAGTRSDPFFFNLGGFKNAVATAEGACGAPAMACPGLLPHDAAGCLSVPSATAGALRGELSDSAPPSPFGSTTMGQALCADGTPDCFVNYNVKAIVIQLDADLLNEGSNHLLSVWAGTYAAS